MSQERKRVDDVHESDSDQEIDFDAAWKERFGEDSSKETAITQMLMRTAMMAT